MSRLTYEAIAPLVHRTASRGGTLEVAFRCPATDAVVRSEASVRRGTGLKDVAIGSAKRGVMHSLRRSVLGAVRSALGYGVVGRVVRDVAGSLLAGAEEKANEHFSEEEEQAAVVDAFERVRGQFAWDPKGQRWVSATAAGDAISAFTRQLSEAPVEARYDRAVLARMLVEVANADGRMAAEERDFLSGFLTDEVGTVDQIMSRGALSDAELAETSEGKVRETLLMLAWAVALTDEDLDPAEARKLEGFARGLGLPEDRMAAMKQTAQLHVLQEAIDAAYSDGHDATKRQDILRLAQHLGLEASEAERAEIRYRKAHGLI